MGDGGPPPSMNTPRFRLVPAGRIDRTPVSQSPHLSDMRTPDLRPPSMQTTPVTQGNSVHVVPSTPVNHHVTMRTRAPSTTPEQGDEVITKCVRFFRTLISLSQQPDQQGSGRNTAAAVNELVTNVIFGDMVPEEFTRKLQEALQSQAQPHLLPFLERTLPTLRAAISNGEVVIDGINPPAGFIPNNPNNPMHHVSTPVSGIPVSRGPTQLYQHQTPRSTPNMHPQSVQHVQIQQVPPQQVHQVHQPPPQAAQQTPQQVPDLHQNPRVEHMDDEPIPQADDEVIQVRQLQESALKASILRPEDIMKKITQRMNEACYVEEEVLTLISDATEYRLREILGELSVLAEHRVDPLRLNNNYGQVDDTRRQLRFLEDVDRQQEEQRETREKEALIRMSKGKGIAKDTIERAKEMQRADAEAKKNRDANAAAIAALSGSKSSRPKWDQVGSSGSSSIVRPRTVRVNIRDLHALFNNDPLCLRTHLIHKLALCGGPQSDSI
ncbi:unnamed protein product [Auanema sp. JU1783]|nr:unnamed protein product [Auanema sp. JU1783]